MEPLSKLHPMPSAPTLTDINDNIGNNEPQIVVPGFPSTGTNNSVAELGETEIKRLMEQGYTRGLALSLNDVKKSFYKRVWIVDNSGSMQTTDGHKLVATGHKANQMKLVGCSRWEEIQECVSYHIQLAATLEAPTTFRLLNNPGATMGGQQMSVATAADGSESTPQHTQKALEWIRKIRPGGCTPLTQHILEIQQEVSAMKSTLIASGQRYVLVLCTDGLPTNAEGYGGEEYKQEFVRALRSLEGLPLWICIRLSTDDDQVVEFYNYLDSQLELSIEVLDDLTAEAKEVHSSNPWLTYGLPLHRMRELGFHDRVFDLLDERRLSSSELRDFFAILLGRSNMDGIPDPAIDWDGFYHDIKRLVKSEQETWDPRRKRNEPWIDMHQLNKVYGDGGGCSIL